MADLQELLARLNSQGAASPGAQAGSSNGHGSNYHQPSVSSPIFSPSPSGPQPQHSSAIMSPNVSAANTPGPRSNAPYQPQEQANNLLNLLRFNQQPSASQTATSNRRPSHNTQTTEASGSHGRAVSASDLVASFMSKPSPQPSVSSNPVAAGKPETPAAQVENPQDLLLSLLKTKPSQTANASALPTFSSPAASQLPGTVVDDVARDLAEVKLDDEAMSSPTPGGHAESPMRVFGHDGTGNSSTFQPDTSARASPFTYVNPFEKLEAATPRNRTPAPEKSASPVPKMEILKPKHGRDTSSAVGGDNKDQPASKTRKISIEPSHPHETVSEAVTGLGEQVDKEVEEALAAAESSNGKLATPASPIDVKEVEEAIIETATEIKKELEDEENAEALNDTLPKPLAEALKDVVDKVADSWESAEAEDSNENDEGQAVKVYKFPMRAFASITIQNMPERRSTFSTDIIMDIARLKKEFDQIDRSLVSASKNFIAYGLPKTGGFRVIRQENGTFRHVFQSHHERIFNMAVCTSGDDSPDAVESILGIGVNGTVFWTSLAVGREDHFGEHLDSEGLILPPSPSQDDNTSGGQLKTRAKPSSRHPDFFAVGRGKSIHIVWPKVAADYVRAKSRVCHTEKYLKERSLKILTGKAGKDFTFSEDDTVIVSLDKAGRMRFWDIQKLTEPSLGVLGNPASQVEVSQTLLEFNTTSPTAKSWPTSVFFFDKDKPFNKGIALRYVMVGMKQNHTFQLWDLGLGKAVQEINLPHEKESDAICSVAFHPKTGIMAVAHPTRNSIYFIHVSCPRYNLPLQSQASYIARLANKTERARLPPVNATAIMTSIAEYSFAPKGQIRSLHMLNDPVGQAESDDPENSILFELYVMHSKGVCNLGIRRSDLGWKKEGEPLNPRDAMEEDVITLATLKPPQPITEESSTGGDTPAAKSATDRSTRESIKKESTTASRQSMTPEAAMRASTLAKVESKQDAARAAIMNASEKSDKKKKKRLATDTASQASSVPRGAPPSYAQAAQSTSRPKTPPQEEIPAAAMAPLVMAPETEAPEWAKQLISQHLQQPSLSASVADVDITKMQEVIQSEIGKLISLEFTGLYKRMEDDRQIQTAAGAARQDAVLRLVSSTLSENVEKVFNRMVNESVQQILLPGVVASIQASVEKTMEKSITHSLKPILSANLTKELPEAVSRAVKNPAFMSSIQDAVTRKVSTNIEATVTASMGSVVNPAVAGFANKIEQQLAEQLRQAQSQRHSDAMKIDQLAGMVQSLSQTVQTMATNQMELQGQLAKLQRSILESRSQSADGSAARSSPRLTRSPVKPQTQKTPVQLEIEEITRLMSEGKVEQGTMQWLQSEYVSELFENVFMRCNPAYLSEVSALLALSTGAVVTATLDNLLAERLIWLDAVLSNVNPMDPEIQDIVPRIMELLNQRLTSAYIRLNENSPGHALLRRISALITKVNELTRNVAAQRH